MDVAGVSIGTGSGTLYDGNERVIGFSVGRSLNSMVSTGDSTVVENGLLDARRSIFVDFGDGVRRMHLIRIRSAVSISPLAHAVLFSSQFQSIHITYPQKNERILR